MDIFGACLLGKIQFKVCAGMEKNWEIFDSDQLNQFQHRLVTLKYLKHTKPNMFSRLIKYSCSERNKPFVFESFYYKKKTQASCASDCRLCRVSNSLFSEKQKGPKKNRWPSSFNQAKGYVTNRLKCYWLWQQLPNEKKQKRPFTAYLPLREEQLKLFWGRWVLVPLSVETKSALCSDRTKPELLSWKMRGWEGAGNISNSLSAPIQEKASRERGSQSEEICSIIQ